MTSSKCHFCYVYHCQNAVVVFSILPASVRRADVGKFTMVAWNSYSRI